MLSARLSLRTFLRRSECSRRPRRALYSTKSDSDNTPPVPVPVPHSPSVQQWAAENKDLHSQPSVARWASTARRPPDRPIPVLKVLDRPLGVRERPTLVKPTRMQRFKDIWLNEPTILEERKHLIKQLNKGYYTDVAKLIRPGHMGKTWIAPEVLIREDKSLYLPNIKGKDLEKKEQKHTTLMCYGKITLLAIESTELSVLQTKSFISSVHPRFESNPLYQRMHINIQENMLKALVVNLFLHNLRANVPKELYGNCLLSTQNMEYLREPMGCVNKMVGYIYLIDENLKIRWAAGGDATAVELKALESCLTVLLKRLEEKKKKEKQPPPVQSPP
ncbi:ATP10 protein-domain-containing protein [Mycena albidolilacea]|uniref:ATP10 protein-domain-containing protein n=1 Tax=Mycena albidolilacea TaxID=1033008 RepID=A0AAD7A6F9_9AGAR|nr:ATP10 protein-domain-containing protein [Mycena albidolilacea]